MISRADATSAMVRWKADEIAVEQGCYYSQPEADAVIGFIERFCRHSKGEFAGKPFILLDWQRDFISRLYGWQRADGTRRFRRAYMEVAKKQGKALALNTPIPTPGGWATIGDLSVGDLVFDEQGLSCKVVAATEVMHGRECYRLRFSDGCEIIADADHQWLTTARRTCGTHGDRRSGPVGIRTTKEIAQHVRVEWKGSAGSNHSVSVAGPLMTDEAILPIHPYVLGAWLGDGTSSQAALTCAYSDMEIVEAVRDAGVSAVERASSNENTGLYRLGGVGKFERRLLSPMQTRLRRLGLLDNKHVPSTYLRASYSQRLALLQGLMDTDGTIGKTGQCVFYTTRKRLCDNVVELIRTLGFKPLVHVKDAKINGRYIGPCWAVQFYAFNDTPVFRLSRKVVRQKPRPNKRARSESRHIISVECVDSVPVRCIQVSSPSHLFLAGESMIPTHNSALCSALSLFHLCADGEPGAEVYNAAADRNQASIVYNEAANMVDQSPALQGILKTIRSTKRIVYAAKQSVYCVLSAEAPTKEGLNSSFTVFDELHAQKFRNLWDTLYYAGAARRQPLAVSITTAGSDRDTVCWEQHEYALGVINGTIEDVSFFGAIYAANPDDDIEDPATWAKANPSLGVTVDAEEMKAESAKAAAFPSERNKFLRYRLNIWTEATDRFFDMLRWDSCHGCKSGEDHAGWRARMLSEIEGTGTPVFIGSDLSSTRDITACVLCWEREGKRVLVPFFWLPEKNLFERQRPGIERWKAEGLFEPMPGDTVNLAVVEDWIRRMAERINLVEYVYDPYAATQLVKSLEDSGITCEKFRQGFLSMSPAMKGLQVAYLNGMIEHGGNPVLRWMAANTDYDTDPAGNVKPIKPGGRNVFKIDGIVASIMAHERSMLADVKPVFDPLRGMNFG